MDDEWALGNQMFMTNEPNARPITVSYVNATARPFQRTDEQGFLDNGGFNITQRGHAFNRAIYLSDSWRIDKWLLDASVRFENQDATNRVCNLTNVRSRWQSADALQQRRAGVQRHACRHGLRRGFHLVDGGRQLQLHRFHVDLCAREPRRPLRGFRQRHPRQHHRQHAADAGHPQLRSRLQVPERSDLCRHQRATSATSPACSISRPTAPARRPAPSCVRLRVEGHQFHRLRSRPVENFRFQVVANCLDGEYTDYDACFPFTNVVTGDGCAPIEGKQLQRQPKLRYMLTPSYRVPAAVGRYRGVRHLHACRRSHAGSVGAAATGLVLHLGFRHHRERRRQLAVRLARHERDGRARPHRKQLAHLRRGSRHWRRVAGAAARRQRDQFPGEVSVVVVGVSPAGGSIPRYTVLQSCAAFDSSASAPRWPNGSRRYWPSRVATTTTVPRCAGAAAIDRRPQRRARAQQLRAHRLGKIGAAQLAVDARGHQRLLPRPDDGAVISGTGEFARAVGFASAGFATRSPASVTRPAGNGRMIGARHAARSPGGGSVSSRRKPSSECSIGIGLPLLVQRQCVECERASPTRALRGSASTPIFFA